MNWIFNWGNSTSTLPSSSSPPSNSRKDVPWVSPKKTYPVEIVPFNQAKDEANSNFFNKVKAIEAEIKSKKS